MYRNFCAQEPDYLVAADIDLYFEYTTLQYACGIVVPDMDYIADVWTHRTEIADNTIVPVLRTVSQKIIDYKTKQGAR